MRGRVHAHAHLQMQRGAEGGGRAKHMCFMLSYTCRTDEGADYEESELIHRSIVAHICTRTHTHVRMHTGMI